MKSKILTLGLICLLMMGCALSAQKKIEIKSWQELFTEQIERVLIIVKDKDDPDEGIILRFTDHYRHKVGLNIGTIEKELKNHGYKIEDIQVVIHNHFTKCKFSNADYKQYRTLKSYGFDGRFLIYCHRTGKVYNIVSAQRQLKKESDITAQMLS